MTEAYYGKFQTTAKCITCLIEKWHQMCSAFLCVVLYNKVVNGNKNSKTVQMCTWGYQIYKVLIMLIDINFDENSWIIRSFKWLKCTVYRNSIHNCDCMSYNFFEDFQWSISACSMVRWCLVLEQAVYYSMRSLHGVKLTTMHLLT